MDYWQLARVVMKLKHGVQRHQTFTVRECHLPAHRDVHMQL